MAPRTLRLAVAAGVFAIAFAVYAMTLTPTVGLTDSGALTVAAWSLGNAHPPGFPLYLLLTHAAMSLPIGSIAVRANLASAFFAALACAMVALAIAEMILSTPRAKKEPATPDRVIAILMAFGGLLLCFARTLWGYATVAEVYALNTFLLATIAWLLLSWRRSRDSWRIIVAAVVFGLALGVHHVTIGLTLLAIAVLVLRTAGFAFFRTRTFVICAVVAIVAVVAIYAYLPLAASHGAPLNWGNPNNAARIIDHITAKQYRTYVNTSSSGSQLDGIIDYTMQELGPTWLPIALLLALYGLLQTLRRDRTLFWFLLLIIAANVAWSIVYPIANDEDAYLLPTFVALVLAAAYGSQFIVRSKPAFAAALLILPLVAAGVHWPYRDRRDFTVPRDFADNAFNAMEPNALLMTNNWQLYAPSRYFLDVEKKRPDVKIVFHGMLIRSWYIDSLVQRYPTMMDAVWSELAAYRPLLAEFEGDTERWRNDASMRNQMNARLDELILALIRNQISRGGHAYATPDVALSRESVDANLVQQIATTYETLPRGVVMEMLPGHKMRPLPNVAIDTASVTRVRYEPDDVVIREIIPTYVNALRIRARYLGVTNHFADAVHAYEQALALDPANTAIERELQQMRVAAAQQTP